MNIIISILLLLVALFMIAFFSGMEIAFVSVNKFSIQLAKKHKKKNIDLLKKFLSHPDRFISTCIIGVNIFFVIYGMLFSDIVSYCILIFDLTLSEYIKIILETIISTLMLLILGDYLPKSLFKMQSKKVLFKFVPIIYYCDYILHWINIIFITISTFVLDRIIHLKKKDYTEIFSYYDLETFYTDVKKNTTQLFPQVTLFENALKIPNNKIKKCIIPRTKIDAIDEQSSIENVESIFTQTKHTCLIVYKKNIDNIIGYIHHLALFDNPTSIHDMIIPIPILKDNLSIGKALSQLIESKKTLALVIDEFNETVGIITIEGLIEEIFGELNEDSKKENPFNRSVMPPIK